MGVKAGSSWPWSRAGKQRAGRSLGGGPGGVGSEPLVGLRWGSLLFALALVPGGLGRELSPVSGQVAGGFAVP